MQSSDLALARKALVYAICLDIIRGAINSIGSVNTADASKSSMIIYEELTKAAKTTSDQKVGA